MKNIEHLKDNLHAFEANIGYSFKNKNNLILALTHSSYANENKELKLQSNERVEFLGDSVLGLSISEKIYKRYSNLSEGELTKVRANIVCEPSLLKCSNQIEIYKYILLGKGEELTGGRKRSSLLSDAFEAVIGSIYIDGSLEEAKEFVYKQMETLIADCAKGAIAMDYKTQLQEVIQKKGDRKVFYEIVEEKGPDHDKLFVADVKLGDEVIGTGEGKSKKEAEQNAAKLALEKKW